MRSTAIKLGAEIGAIVGSSIVQVGTVNPTGEKQILALLVTSLIGIIILVVGCAMLGGITGGVLFELTQLIFWGFLIA